MIPSQFPVVEFAELDSTNAEALRRIAAGETGPLWIVAERQTAGKGRSGRVWTSSGGNLYASLLIPLSARAVKTYQVSLVAGVAVYDAVYPEIAPAHRDALRLKWPNDLLIDAAKTGGILVESTARPQGGGLAVVVGIGLNVASHPADLGRLAGDMASFGARISTRDLLARLGITLARWLEIWDEGRGFGPVREAWIARAGPMGELLTVNAAAGLLTGTYCGLDADGALLIANETGKVHTVNYGDVTLAG